jgi:hypothetical protein
MTARQSAAGLPPIACSLTTADLAKQARRWKSVARRAMAGRIRTADGVRLRFTPGPGIEEELHALVAVEKECCPWAEWTVHSAADQLTLDVRSAGEGVAAVHSMFGRSPSPLAGQRPRSACRWRHRSR